MEAVLVISSAALAYQYARTKARAELGIVNKRHEEFHDGGDFEPDTRMQEPVLRSFGDLRKRGPTVNTIYNEQIENFRQEGPIGTLNLRSAGYRPMWMEQDAPPRQQPMESLGEMDTTVESRIDVDALRRSNLTDSVTRHLRSNTRVHDGVRDDQEHVEPPVRGGPRRDSDILQPRYHAFNFGEDLTGHEIGDLQQVRGHHVGSAKPVLIRADQAHEVRADRSMDMHGVSGLKPGGVGGVRGRMAASGQALPTLEWEWGRSGNRASVLAAGGNTRDGFVEETRGMDVNAAEVSQNSSKGTQHQQRGAMRNKHTFGLRTLLDLPSVSVGNDRAPAVSTVTAAPRSQMTGPLVEAPSRPDAAASTSTQKRPAALSGGFGDATNRRPDLAKVDLSVKTTTSFRGMSAAPRSSSTGPIIPELPPVVIARQHNVGQSTAIAPTRGATDNSLLTEDVNTLENQSATGVRSNEMRLNRNSEAIRLQDELNGDALTAPRSTPLAYTRPISTLLPSQNAQREPGEFRRR